MTNQFLHLVLVTYCFTILTCRQMSVLMPNSCKTSKVLTNH